MQTRLTRGLVVAGALALLPWKAGAVATVFIDAVARVTVKQCRRTTRPTSIRGS